MGIMLVFSPAASAHEEKAAKVEAFTEYSYFHMNLSGIGFNINSGIASASINPTSCLGIVSEHGGYHTGNISGVPVDFNLSSHLFGPKLAHRAERFTPFVKFLFGSADGPLGTFGVSGPSSEGAFAVAVGGDPDLNATRHIGIRLIQASA